MKKDSVLSDCEYLIMTVQTEQIKDKKKDKKKVENKQPIIEKS